VFEVISVNVILTNDSQDDLHEALKIMYQE